GAVGGAAGARRGGWVRECAELRAGLSEGYSAYDVHRRYEWADCEVRLGVHIPPGLAHAPSRPPLPPCGRVSPMDDLNPYRPPLSHDGGDTPVPPAITQLLRQTKPWVTFLAILGFIGAGFMALVGVAVVAIGSSLGPKGLPWPFGLIYILGSVLYLFPSLFLLRY